jgi:beta-galactosidase
VLSFAGGELDGRPAVTHNRRAWYFATRPEPALMRALYADICAAAGVEPVVSGAPDGVEAVRRGDTLYLLNHTSAPTEVRLGGRTIALAARGVERVPAVAS